MILTFLQISHAVETVHHPALSSFAGRIGERVRFASCRLLRQDSGLANERGVRSIKSYLLL